jgi:hypothetical protein
MRQAQRCVSGDATLASDDFIQAGKGYPQSLSKGGLADSKRLEKLFQEHLTRMRRGPFGR